MSTAKLSAQSPPSVGGLEQVPTPEAKPALGLSDLESMALGNNPTIAVHRARINALRGKWLQAGLPPNPVAGYVADEIGSGGTAGLQGGYIGQTFITGHKLRLDRAVVEQEIVAAEQDLAAQRLRILTDVRKQFFRALIAQRRIELTSRLLQIGRKAEGTIKQRLPQEARRSDYLQARGEAGRSAIALNRSRNQHLAVWRDLAAVIGMPNLAPQPLDGNAESAVPEWDWNASLDRLLTTSPEMAAALANVDRACWAVRRARAEAIPNVTAEAKLQYDDEVEDTVVGLAIGLPLPIWNRNQGGIRQAQSEHVAAQKNVRRVELLLRQRLANVFQQYVNARFEAQQFETDIVPAAKETIDLVTQAYNAGEQDYLDLLTAQRSYFESSLNYLEALEAVWVAAQRIEGLMLEESLRDDTAAR